MSTVVFFKTSATWPDAVARLGGLLIWALFLPPFTALAEMEPREDPRDRRAGNRKQIEQWTERMRTEIGDDSERHLEFGLLADRRERRVRLWAEATGIQPGKVLEFALIAEHSGHDYEALAVTPVKPSAVHQALEFINVPAGLPVDPAGLRFWPRGERVMVVFRWTLPAEDGALAPEEQAAVEQLLFNRMKQAPVAVRGFVFTGSLRRPHPLTGEPSYAADVFGPGSIISLYNEPLSVMDVPYLAAQGAVYGSMVPNPDIMIPPGTLLEVILEPEYPSGRRRVMAAQLLIAPPADMPADGPHKLRYTIVPDDPDDQAPSLENGSLVELLAWLGGLAERGRDPFIRPRPDTEIPWDVLRDFYRIIEALEAGEGIRIDPPPENRFYFRTFLPSEWFRDRSERLFHPDELHLARESGNEDRPAAVWKRFEEQWPDDQAIEPAVRTLAIPVADHAALTDWQRERGYRPQPAVLLVFAPPSLPLSRLHEWMLPLRDVYPTQYVFEAD